MRAILKRYLLVRMDPRAYITCSTSFFPRLIRRLAPMESSCCWFGLLFRALNNPQRQAGQMTRLVGRSSRSGSGGRYMNVSHKLITLGLVFGLIGSTSAFARPTPHFEMADFRKRRSSV